MRPWGGESREEGEGVTASLGGSQGFRALTPGS